MVDFPLSDHSLTEHTESDSFITGHPGTPIGASSQFLPALLTATTEPDKQSAACGGTQSPFFFGFAESYDKHGPGLLRLLEDGCSAFLQGCPFGF